jgi:hypothetical protein
MPTFVVPFDGSELSKAALTKARLYAVGLEEIPRPIAREMSIGGPLEIVAVSVIPESARYARENGWIEEGEEFRVRTVAERLHRQVTDVAPSANFQTVRVGSTGAGSIGRELRQKAIDLGATDVFIGSENAGRIVTPVSSVGRSVAAADRYDVHIVRRKLPPKARERLRSEFFVTD